MEKEKALKLLGRKCQRCGKTKNLDVHHIDYLNLYKETAFDVEILCKECHKPADKEREVRTGYNTWLRNKFGEWADHHNDERTYEQYLDYIYREY